MGSCRPGSSSINSLEFFAGHVLYYFLHSITLNGKCVQNVFACVLWHKPDENPDRLKLNDFLAHVYHVSCLCNEFTVDLQLQKHN